LACPDCFKGSTSPWRLRERRQAGITHHVVDPEADGLQLLVRHCRVLNFRGFKGYVKSSHFVSSTNEYPFFWASKNLAV